jgi:hypothetical protein
MNENHGETHWRDCGECRATMGVESYVGQGTSNCNFAEDYWEDVPAFEPTCCAKCGKMVKVNSEGYSTGPKGTYCENCTAGLNGFPRRGNPGQVTIRLQE